MPSSVALSNDPDVSEVVVEVPGARLSAIHLRFALPYPLPEGVAAAIKQADRIAAYYEATSLAGFAIGEAQRYFGPVVTLAEPMNAALMAIHPETALDAQRAFLRRFAQLNAAQS